MRAAIRNISVFLILWAGSAAGQTVAEGIGLFEEGEFEAASTVLQQALEAGIATSAERSKVRKYLGLSHIVCNFSISWGRRPIDRHTTALAERPWCIPFAMEIEQNQGARAR